MSDEYHKAKRLAHDQIGQAAILRIEKLLADPECMAAEGYEIQKLQDELVRLRGEVR